MKAIVLAGGHATRLWPLTKHRAKPLLPLAGKPIIAYTLDQIVALDDIDEILISTNAKFADDFEAFIDEHNYDNVRTVVEDQASEDEKLGSLGAMMQVMDAEGRDDYLIVGGDNYLSLDLGAFLTAARKHDAMTTACFDLDTREEAQHFGVIETADDGQITGFEEKPDEPSSTLASTAVYYFPEQTAEMFDAYVETHEGTDTDYLDEPGRLIEWGHTRYDLYAYPFEGEWFDIGTPQNYLRAQATLGDNPHNGSATGSELGENVWLMDGAEVSDSVLENCIVFPGARISDACVRNSIIDEEATVDGVDLEESVIGAHSALR